MRQRIVIRWRLRFEGIDNSKDEELLKQEMEYVKENFDYDAVIEWHEDVYKCALNRKMRSVGSKIADEETGCANFNNCTNL